MIVFSVIFQLFQFCSLLSSKLSLPYPVFRQFVVPSDCGISLYLSITVTLSNGIRSGLELLGCVVIPQLYSEYA